METNQDKGLDPAEDDNQGVVQLLAQAEQANNDVGVEQAPHMGRTENPAEEQNTTQPVNETDQLANGTNDDSLAEEDVESRELGE